MPSLTQILPSAPERCVEASRATHQHSLQGTYPLSTNVRNTMEGVPLRILSCKTWKREAREVHPPAAYTAV